MRRLRSWWRRLRGWWLLVMAAVVTAVVSAVGKEYTGVAAAMAVAVGGLLAAVLSERGRARLAERASSTWKRGALYVSRVDRITDPIRLGVHPAAALEHADGEIDCLPPFIERDCSLDLAEALRAGGFVLVVGDSTAGKTRLAYETTRACLPRHTCVVPENPAALSDAIIAARQHRPSVLWLDDLERYLRVGGLTRADLDIFLQGKAGQIIVIATLRAHEREWFSQRYDSGREHDDRQQTRTVRDVLHAVTREIRLERRWSGRELTAAHAFEDDFRVRRALASALRYGLAEHMAAGPELLRDLRDAWSVGGGRARGAALVTAAVDVRRIRYHQPVPLELLRNLHETYLQDRGGAALRPESWGLALEWATQPLHATSSLLEPHAGEEFLAFDYLVDAAAQDPTLPPVPDATWHAVLGYVAPADLVGIAWEASFASRFDHVQLALDRAVALSEYVVAAALAGCLGLRILLGPMCLLSSHARTSLLISAHNQAAFAPESCGRW